MFSFYFEQIKLKSAHALLNLQDQSHTSNCPSRGLFFRLQVEGPHIRRPSLARFVHGTAVNIFGILFARRNRLDIHHWHGRGELFHSSGNNDTFLKGDKMTGKKKTKVIEAQTNVLHSTLTKCLQSEASAGLLQHSSIKENCLQQLCCFKE